MKRLILILSLVFAVLGGTLLSAEEVSITLQDGTVLRGEILKESSLSVTLKYRNERGIMDQMQINKDDIKERRVIGPDDIAFEPIKATADTPDLVPVERYRELVQAAERFLEIFDDSRHAPEVRKILEKLQEELKLAEAGGIQLNGEWISPEERQTNAYEIDMRIALNKMKEELEEGKLELALRRFEKIRENFIHSETYDEARQLAIQALQAYRPRVTDMLARVDSRVAKRKRDLLTIEANKRAEEEKAIEARDAQYERLIAQQKEAGTKWITLEPFHKSPMQETMRNIDNELRALDAEASSETERKAAGPVYRDAWAAARAGQLDEGKKLVTQLKTLKVPQRYLDPLQEILNPAEPEPETKPPTTGTPEPDPGETTEEPEPEEEKPKKETTPAPTTTEQDAQDEEEKGFPIQIVLVIVLVLVIVGALVAAFAGKRK